METACREGSVFADDRKMLLSRLSHKALAVFCSIALAFSMVPIVPKVAFAVTASSTNNVWGNRYSYNYANTVKSYLEKTPSGYQRVEWTGSDLIVEDYDTNFALRSNPKTIDKRYLIFDGGGAGTLKWGGYLAGKTYNFVVVGQDNVSRDPQAHVLRYVKFDKNWNYIDSHESGPFSWGGGMCGYIISPFDAGSLRMIEKDGNLLIRTSFEGSEEHQCNFQLVMNQSDFSYVMWPKPSTSNLGPTANYLGYVSHSFNQYLTTLGSRVYSLDHGDSYLSRNEDNLQGRGVDVQEVLEDFPTQYRPLMYSFPMKFAGSLGANYTGAELGGFSSSETRVTLLSAFSSVDQSGSSPNANTPANIYIGVTSGDPSIVGKDGDTGLIPSNLIKLTNYSSLSKQGSCPQLVKITDDRFLVMWGVREGNNTPSGIEYCFVNGQGQPLGSIMSASAALSDCQPIVSGNKVVWYTTGAKKGGSTLKTEPFFYQLDASAGTLTGGYDLSKSTVSASDVTFTRTAQTPQNVAVFLGSMQLKEGTDYTIGNLGNNTNAGTATFVITGKGAYSGTRNGSFKINPMSIAGLAATGISSQTYTGKPLMPKPAFYHGEYRLVEGTDYTLAYSNNTKVGTATVKATGKGNYTGTRTFNFTIVGQSSSSSASGTSSSSGSSGSSSGKPTTNSIVYKAANGKNRYNTMELVVKDAFSKGSCQEAVLATGTNFPDALAASGLAGSLARSTGKPVPVIITSGTSLSSEARSLLSYVGAKHVYIAGGTGALSSTVENQVRSMGIRTDRMAGANRSATAVQMAKTMPTRSKTCIIATGANYADALSISPYAYATASPIFLVEKGALSSLSISAIKSGKYTRAIIVGGSAVVPTSVSAQLRAAGVSQVGRWSGANRYVTSSIIAKNSIAEGALTYSGAYIATGKNFPDALCASSCAAESKATLLLVDDGARTCIDSVMVPKKTSVRKINYVGGTGVVSTATRNYIKQKLG